MLHFISKVRKGNFLLHLDFKSSAASQLFLFEERENDDYVSHANEKYKVVSVWLFTLEIESYCIAKACIYISFSHDRLLKDVSPLLKDLFISNTNLRN